MNKNKKERKSITFEIKLDVLKRFEAGQKTIEIANELGLARSTVATIKANKNKISSCIQNVKDVAAKNSSRKRSNVMEQMEKCLSIWIDHQAQRNVPVSSAIIKSKAKSLHEDLLSKTNESSGEIFLASNGWFERFKCRHSLHTIKTSGEAASSDFDAARSYPEEFAAIIAAGGYTAQQIYNVDESGLFWKRMPNRTITASANKSVYGFKAAKERLTILFGANATGDNKLKPMVIYNSENPRALKGHNKASLPIIWRSNKKGWMTATLFNDWINNHFSIAVKKFSQEKNITNKALLIIDNAPSHIVVNTPENVKIVFLPPNTTPLLQPMDMGVIANFKAYYLRRVFKCLIESLDGPEKLTIKEFWKAFNILDAIKNISLSWDEVKEPALNKVWFKLWPACVDRTQNSSETDITLEVQNEIVAIAHQAGLDDIELDSVAQLLGSKDEDISNEDLIDIIQNKRKYIYIFSFNLMLKTILLYSLFFMFHFFFHKNIFTIVQCPVQFYSLTI